MKKILPLFTILWCIQIAAQNDMEDAWLFLKDKPNKATFLANPLSMLSKRALDRRNQQNICLDSLDVPVDENYYNQLKSLGNITVLAKSKWLNAIHIQGTANEITDLLTNFSFIYRIEFANKSLNTSAKKQQKKIIPNHQNKFKNTQTNFNYSSTENQLKMLRGDYLHEQGLTGAGQYIAILDAGFPNVNTLEAFKRLRDNNQILGGYDFVARNDNFYAGDSHGTHVLSTIGGYIENEFVGAAPNASFYLFRTENAPVEVPLEESLWVEAAERADSLGVDVINTSLGYTTFDNPNYNYSYEDMNGNTTFISKGAEIATTRGILVIVSAGNSGFDSWKYIGAPADAASVITVGAVNASKNIASFSSFGPSFDGRIKPEILAQGVNASIINYISGQVSSSNGTSFSAPIMAGLISCLNEFENPLLKTPNTKNKNGTENKNTFLKKAIYESADTFLTPQNQYGYGIPNFEVALEKYFGYTANVYDNVLSKFSIFPNPVINSFTINTQQINVNEISLEIYSILGKKVLEKINLTSHSINVSQLEKGIYFLKIQKGNQFKTVKLVKN